MLNETTTEQETTRDKRRAFSKLQIFQIFKRVEEGEKIVNIAHELGFGQSAYSNWRSAFNDEYKQWLNDGTIIERPSNGFKHARSNGRTTPKKKTPIVQAITPADQIRALKHRKDELRAELINIGNELQQINEQILEIVDTME